MAITPERNGGATSKSSTSLQTATPLGDSDDPKSQEILAFRRNPEEWSRRKYREINAVRVSCSHTCQAFIDLIHKDVLDVLDVHRSMQTTVGASKSTVGMDSFNAGV
jgi:hypothetical protein